MTLVPPGETRFPPPRPLGTYGAALWGRVMDEYQLEDSGGVELLALACQALDRAEALREKIDRDGEVLDGEKGPRDHPGLRHELANRAFVAKTLDRLGLNLEAPKPGPGRPPQPRGWTGQ